MAADATDGRPDFLVIGAMKCATTTLHAQLARQPGVFMSDPKEPNYFSDDDVFARGADWYASLFRGAPPGSVRGESSTHYAKLPAYPRTVERIARALPGVKFVDLMRNPIDRLISQYVHERTVGRVGVGVEAALAEAPGLIDYGRYAMQLAPYLDAFGPARVLPVFFRSLVDRPHDELRRIGRFLGVPTRLAWDETLGPQNVGSERLRRSVVRETLVKAPVLTPLRRRLVPPRLALPLKALWRAREGRPTLPAGLEARLEDVFDEDLERLGAWLGVSLTCRSFDEAAVARPPEWRV